MNAKSGRDLSCRPRRGGSDCITIRHSQTAHLVYAQAHSEELNASSIMACTPSRGDKMPSYDDIYPVPIAVIDDAVELDGFSAQEGDSDVELDGAVLEDLLSDGLVGLDADVLGEIEPDFE